MIVDKSPSKPVLSVSELNQYARGVLEMQVGKIAVSGEISNFSQPASGHWYFTLKDSQAQIRCAMFRNKNQFLKIKPGNGMQVVIHGSVSIYEGRGDYQLIADYLEEAGIGNLQKQFELLKAKLAAEGLFASVHKQALPKNPQHIAVITSATGAAIHDILTVLNERFPLLRVTLIPCTVQGAQAPAELCQALAMAERWNSEEIDSIDAIIIGRGGGSIEDLWAFNDEHLARAIFACKIPVISAVGHEVDITIADYVADVRAPTPSAAAEIISPDQHAITQQLDHLEHTIFKRMAHSLANARQKTAYLEKSLHHPGDKLKQYQLQFARHEQQLTHQIQRTLSNRQHQLSMNQQRLLQSNPENRVHDHHHHLAQLLDRIVSHCTSRTQMAKQTLMQQAALLNAVSPLATLGRGYAIIKNEDGDIVRHAQQQQVGSKVSATLAEGELICTITHIKP